MLLHSDELKANKVEWGTAVSHGGLWWLGDIFSPLGTLVARLFPLLLHSSGEWQHQDGLCCFMSKCRRSSTVGTGKGINFMWAFLGCSGLRGEGLAHLCVKGERKTCGVSPPHSPSGCLLPARAAAVVNKERGHPQLSWAAAAGAGVLDRGAFSSPWSLSGNSVVWKQERGESCEALCICLMLQDSYNVSTSVLINSTCLALYCLWLLGFYRAT